MMIRDINSPFGLQNGRESSCNPNGCCWLLKETTATIYILYIDNCITNHCNCRFLLGCFFGAGHCIGLQSECRTNDDPMIRGIVSTSKTTMSDNLYFNIAQPRKNAQSNGPTNKNVFC